MARILIVSSNIHKELSSTQLVNCLERIKKFDYDYQVEIIDAGSYEIPFVINSYHQQNSFDGYIALGLLLKSNAYHYDYITSHLKLCFSHFALNNIVVGNGIISGASIEELATKIASPDPCISGYSSAINAVDCLIKLKTKLMLVDQSS